MHEGRISPLFDVARTLLLVDVEGDVEVGRRELQVRETGQMERARRVAALGVQTVICGAISRSLEALLSSSGVWVIPNTCGPVEEVLAGFVTGRFGPRSFLMPGCRGQRRRFRGRHGRRRGRR